MNTRPDLTSRLRAMVRSVERDEASIGVLSTGEQIAVALVLNRSDLLPEGYTHVLEAVERLGPTWAQAALIVWRGGWVQP